MEPPEGARPIPGSSTHWATLDGRIWSSWANTGFLKLNFSNRGRPAVWFKGKTVSAHRLICLAFHGPCPDHYDLVRHIDGDKTNNRPENLAWGNQKQNQADAKAQGTWTHGTKQGLAKLDEYKVRAVRLMCAHGVSAYRIAQLFGMNKKTILSVIHRRTWKHVD